MNTNLLHAEVDGFQVAIIVLAVIFSFLKWLWEQWRGNKGQADSASTDEVERQLREAAWRKQTGQQPPPLQPQVPVRPASPTVAPRPMADPPPSSASPWEEIRKAWRELREAAQTQQQKPPATPPLSRQQAQRPRQAPPPPVSAAPASIPTAPAITATALPHVAQPAVSPLLQSLRNLRNDPAAMRRAIILNEVLGPPKALQG